MTSKRKVTWAEGKGFMADRPGLGEGPFDYETVQLHPCNGECREIKDKKGEYSHTAHDINCQRLFGGDSEAYVLIVGGARANPLTTKLFQVAG